MTAQDIIRALDLAPHPEGGWYRETWRADAPEGERPAGTAIYYLLDVGEFSHWHRVDAAEIWHWYAGECATSLGEWTLCGCTVSPGFDFAGFEMAPPDWRPLPRNQG